MFDRSFRRPAAILLLAASLGLAACGGGDDESSDAGSDSGAASDSGGTAAATIDLKAQTFEPADATIKVGETVEWKWEGGVQHNVKGDDFKSELQNKGEFTHTFDEAGTFAYACDVHPATMKGTITVE